MDICNIGCKLAWLQSFTVLINHTVMEALFMYLSGGNLMNCIL